MRYLRFERRLAHPPEKVWRALTDPVHLSQWYPFQITELEPVVGGKVGFDDGEGTTLTGVVTVADRPRAFAFTEADDELSFELSTVDGGCLLVMTHGFDEANASPGAEQGWRHCLDALELLVTASPTGAEPATFTSDGGVGGVLRFERHLAHPREKVWRALTERDELAGWFAGLVDTDLVRGAHVRFSYTPKAKRHMNVADGEEALGEGDVTVADPPGVLEYTWSGQTLRWELTDEADGCLLVFTTLVDRPDGHAEESAGWHAALEVLEARLDGREPTWTPWDRVGPLEAVYRRRLR